ncbi:MAG: ISAzo13 family transposase [Pleurocapsa sp. MO_226.B13]|nr:ISAzo13 family transposase [Pleurocapsa sp. MO_226.B13]
MSIIESLRTKFEALMPYMDEKLRRLWAASEAATLGQRGVKIVAFATGLSPKTIRNGIKELQTPLADLSQVPKNSYSPKRSRKTGGGRKKLSETDSTLIQDLEKLIDPATRGDPQSLLCWTSKSTSKLADALKQVGHQISPRTVAKLLIELGYSLQSNRKSLKEKTAPDRDAQFQYINQQVHDFGLRRQPVISVDTKKKELIGEYYNQGQEWQRKKEPILVKMHDFPERERGKVIPYGIYDIASNLGWVNVGVDHDTAAFAVASIKQWWQEMGQKMYPGASELLITADCGGSNGYRVRLGQTELQKLATETGLKIQVCHFPPGTSKWNKIEHRMFCHITENWRGRPLVSREVVVNLIGNTTTKTGLNIQAKLDQNSYPIGQKISDEELSKVNLQRDRFQGNWNYSILPNLN